MLTEIADIRPLPMSPRCQLADAARGMVIFLAFRITIWGIVPA